MSQTLTLFPTPVVSIDMDEISQVLSRRPWSRLSPSHAWAWTFTVLASPPDVDRGLPDAGGA